MEFDNVRNNAQENGDPITIENLPLNAQQQRGVGQGANMLRTIMEKRLKVELATRRANQVQVALPDNRFPDSLFAVLGRNDGYRAQKVFSP